MVDFRGGPQQLPLRKPVPAPLSQVKLQTLTPIIPDVQQMPYAPGSITQTSSHNRTRTSSSSTVPHLTPSSTFSPLQTTASPGTYQSTMNQYTLSNTRRTLSNATTSSSVTGNGNAAGPTRTVSSTSTSLRRSTSGHSTMAGGYVALMRKQKATVWCDRAQQEDPRILAQQKAARMRAAREVGSTSDRRIVSGSGSMASGSSSSRAKIRHPAIFKPMISGYTPGSLVGGVNGVPLRLSASEVGDEGNGNNNNGNSNNGDGDGRYPVDAHRRTHSGKSSVNSSRRQTATHSMTATSINKYATDAASPGNSDISPEVTGESPSDQGSQRQASDYFAHTSTGISGGSGSSGERESNFGQMGQIAPQPGRSRNEGKSVDELRRRGSVDDRTMTMTGGKLFIANPDLSD
ncbi:MAG: hypothetical protein M1825_001801 [Sarcosagium campestre]|nr:MAG: hypothetical protein M1825_001801 [Sarcosagium campestre]